MGMTTGIWNRLEANRIETRLLHYQERCPNKKFNKQTKNFEPGQNVLWLRLDITLVTVTQTPDS